MGSIIFHWESPQNTFARMKIVRSGRKLIIYVPSSPSSLPKPSLQDWLIMLNQMLCKILLSLIMFARRLRNFICDERKSSGNGGWRIEALIVFKPKVCGKIKACWINKWAFDTENKLKFCIFHSGAIDAVQRRWRNVTWEMWLIISSMKGDFANCHEVE